MNDMIKQINDAINQLYANECGNIETEYPKEDRQKYPDYKRKFDRDMDWLEEQIKPLKAALSILQKMASGDEGVGELANIANRLYQHHVMGELVAEHNGYGDELNDDEAVKVEVMSDWHKLYQALGGNNEN